MTVIAYDGKTVAADKMSSDDSGFAIEITKIFRWEDKGKHQVLAFCGPTDGAWAMMGWYQAGCPAAEFPNTGRVHDQQSWLYVFELGKPVLEFNRHPVPVVRPSVRFAGGSGREAAMAAFHMGADAEQAAKIACLVMAGSCGLGVDVLELHSGERGGA